MGIACEVYIIFSKYSNPQLVDFMATEPAGMASLLAVWQKGSSLPSCDK